jgi:exopolysaccharide biosynthesis operon protein EpsL
MSSSESGSCKRATGASGKALVAVLALLAQPAAAFWNDRIEVFASETATWDSNVFRISDSVDPQAAIGSGSRSDRILVHTLGATFDIPVSLQRFTGGYTWYATRYNHFDQLDFNGHVARADWLWSVTPHVTGDLGGSDSKSLANFATFAGTNRDLVTAREAHAHANFELTPSWLLHTGAVAAERKHDDPARRVNDVRSTSAELRLSYVTAQDNRIGASYRYEEGKSPEGSLLDGILFDNAYKQNSVGVVGRYQFGGNSRLDGRIDYVRREYEQFTERDYSGPSFRVTHNWTPTGKLTFVTTAMREIAPLDDLQTTFVLLTGVSVKPKWDVSDKVSVQGSLEYSRWEYAARTAIGTDYSHRVRSGGVSVAWRPLRTVLLQAGILREVRTSTLANADYEVTVGSLEARIGF